MSNTISIAGRCSRCLGYVNTAGCQRCWPAAMSEAAESVLCESETYYPPLPELVTGFVPEEQIPVFQRLLRSAVD